MVKTPSEDQGYENELAGWLVDHVAFVTDVGT